MCRVVVRVKKFFIRIGRRSTAKAVDGFPQLPRDSTRINKAKKVSVSALQSRISRSWSECFYPDPANLVTYPLVFLSEQSKLKTYTVTRMLEKVGAVGITVGCRDNLVLATFQSNNSASPRS